MLGECREGFLAKLRFKGRGRPCRSTSVRRGAAGIKAVNEILRAPTDDTALFALEITRCLYVYEPMLGIPRYSLDKALVSLCSKVFVAAIYSEVEGRIKMHLEAMAGRQMASIDECTGCLDYDDSLLDEVVAGYLMIRFRVHGEFLDGVCRIVERADAKLKAKARRVFGSLLGGSTNRCLVEQSVCKAMASVESMWLEDGERAPIGHRLSRDDLEYVRENYPLVSCFYVVPESAGVAHYHARRHFGVAGLARIRCWNRFCKDPDGPWVPKEQGGAMETGWLRDRCFGMVRSRRYDLDLMRELARRSVSFEKAFMEGYVRMVEREYGDAKRRFMDVVEMVRALGMGSVPEIQLWVYDLLSLSHMLQGEYFECVFYLGKAIELCRRWCLGPVGQHFLDCMLVAERIGGVSGPSPRTVLDVWEESDARKIAESEGGVVRDKVLANVALRSEMSSLREIRTLERFTTLRPRTLSSDIQRVLRRFPAHTVMSLYCIDGSLFINDFRGFARVDDGFGDARACLHRILQESRSMLKESMAGGVDRAAWWMQRKDLDTRLGEIVCGVGRRFDGVTVGENVILVVDETTTEFPFESMPVFRGKAVYRVPSLEYLENASGPAACGGSYFYLLDPENNLRATRERMSSFLASVGMTRGVAGRPPSSGECREADACSTLLYFGHGSGLKYLRASESRKTLLLFGCSSAKLLCMENYRRNGGILRHLCRGSVVLGCLWEVTDKDIDGFSIKVVRGLLDGCSSLGQLAARFRGEFKLRYLNGASVVVYGVQWQQDMGALITRQ